MESPGSADTLTMDTLSMTSREYFTLRRHERTLWIEYRNPPVNFFNMDACAELHDIIRAADRDPSLRVLILTGGLDDRYIYHLTLPELAGVVEWISGSPLPSFSRNAITGPLLRGATALNLSLLRKWPAYQRLMLAIARKLRRRVPGIYMLLEMHATYFAIEGSRKITIAAMNGSCNGCGTEMAACFDFRYMVDDAGFTIGQPEVLVGVVPGGGGTQRVSRLLGKARALEFMLGCEQWTPARAKAAGLITDHFPKARFRDEIQRIADRIGRLSPVAWFEARRAIVTGMDMSLERGLATEMSATLHCCDDKGARRVLAEYTKVVEEVILGRPDNPATIDEITEIVNSPRITQHFDISSSDS